MKSQTYTELRERIRPLFKAKMRDEKLPDELEDSLCHAYLSLADWVHRHKSGGKPLLLGVNGAQGSGKSTLCSFLQMILTEAYGYKIAGFSIDDIYLTRTGRERLGREVHPLLVTRGVPGTHDVDLGLQIIQALFNPEGGPVNIPAFDKTQDDRRPKAEWKMLEGPVDMVIFEGWCVGAIPQTEAELIEPINELEREEDSDGVWRAYVNDQLHNTYPKLFNQMDHLIMLKVPSMECVYQWRCLQEQKLAEKTAFTGDESLIMDAEALKRFIMHYERITRHTLAEMPSRADLTLYLDNNHQFINLSIP